MSNPQNQSWLPLIQEAYENMVQEEDTRELGKLLAAANEYMQRDWINQNTSLKVLRQTTGNDNDKNGSGYDLISSNGLRIQSKFRSKAMHLETTRRKSQKNAGSASTSGHVAYSIDEADVYVFTRPDGDYNNPSNANIIAIPASALEDPKNRGFLIRSVPKKIWVSFVGKAKGVLESMDEAKRNA